MNERPASRLIGRVFNDTYVITAMIGRGGMGTVYEATHLRLADKKFALKILNPGLANDSTTLKRFHREAEIAAKLGHPNIVDVVDINTTEEDTPYLVMELLRGESLAERITRRKSLSIDETAEIIRQVASALSALHANFIVHRDLKPANIFLLEGPGTRVKVLDFGLSKMQTRVSVNTQTQSIFGTVYYMSPEQASGKVQAIDHRSDIFSLGCVCYEMLTGCLPFPGDDPIAVVQKVRTMDPAPASTRVSGLPVEVDVLLARAMAKERGHRYQEVGRFANDLCRLARGDLGSLDEIIQPPDLDLTPPIPHIRISPEDITLPPNWDKMPLPPRDASRESLEDLFTPEASEDAPTDPRMLPADPFLLARPKRSTHATGPVPPHAARTMLVPHVRRRWALVVLVLLLSAGLGAAVIIVEQRPQLWNNRAGRRSKVTSTSPAAPAKPAPAQLTLAVSPPGSQVFLDGIAQRGKILRLDPARRTHRVKVTAPGYLTQEIDVSAQVTRTLPISLVKAPVPPATPKAQPPPVRPRAQRNGHRGARQPSTGKRRSSTEARPQEELILFENLEH